MFDYQKYGIDIGQKYASANGMDHVVEVIGVLKYADCGDVVIFDLKTKKSVGSIVSN